ncbi:AMP-binding protein [Stigmatella sp. ncwal1]|uniref:AMP-binding protein n=1 Tax=Stigmatella ashevillensis TaxID=2995309 RepID=A0ABT5DMP7_9BACT|nr:AMP-binding protein [Stigmatella ashevillena]MDC0713627.1 AMP-binding protein [Stigmatella ashevillena]
MTSPTPAFPRQQLEEALQRARAAPLYEGRFPKTESLDRKRWEQLPLTKKDDLRAAYPFGLLAVSPDQLSTYHESSGTSGRPISSYFTEGDWEDILTRFLRNGVRLCRQDMVLIKTPYALVTTAHQMHGAARTVGATIVPADNRSANMPYSRVLRLLHDLPVTVAWCMPTEALLWAHAARKAGQNPAKDFPRLRTFLVAGEPLGAAKRARIEALWGGKRVLIDYGSTETGSLAGECERGHLHLWSDRLYFEVRDSQTGGFHQEGSGTLVVTPLFRKAMPLIRYDMEDTVELSHAPCACGSALPTVRVLGREMGLVNVGARAVSALELEEAIYADAAKTGLWFWRARVREGSLEVEIHADEDSARMRVLQALEAAVPGVRVKVTAVAAERFVPDALLSREVPMQKPRFLFGETEDWKSLDYA